MKNLSYIISHLSSMLDMSLRLWPLFCAISVKFLAQNPRPTHLAVGTGFNFLVFLLFTVILSVELAIIHLLGHPGTEWGCNNLYF